MFFLDLSEGARDISTTCINGDFDNKNLVNNKIFQ